MTYGGFESVVFRHIIRGRVTVAQGRFLQTILRATHSESFVSRHGASYPSLAGETHKAHIALERHAQSGQPKLKLLQMVCDSALRAVEAIRILLPNETVLADLRNALSRTTSGPNMDAATLASEVGSSLPSLENIYPKMVDIAWNTSSGDNVDSIALEIAGRALVDGRDYFDLRADVLGALNSDTPDSSAIFQAVLPSRKSYDVACVVSGASSLSVLESLLVDAQQSPLAKAAGYKFLGWGDASKKLYEFAEEAHADHTRRHGRSACLVSLRVCARDRTSAIRMGRREVSELLDQYVAGHRIGDLRLMETSLGSRVGDKRVATFRSVGPSVAMAYPLTKAWPAQLRESLRMSHLASKMDAPMSSISLAWSALESCGVSASNPRNVDAVADSMALQSLRNQIIESYQSVQQSVNAVLAIVNEDEKSAQRRNEQCTRSLNAITSTSPHWEATRDRASMAEVSAQAAHATAASLREHLGQLGMSIDAYVSKDVRGHLLDANQWLDLLHPPHDSDTATLVRARTALSTLETQLPGIASAELEEWRKRLADPLLCADLLERWSGNYSRMLDGIYAVRNMAVHIGAFSIPGDFASARAAVSFADLVLEFLGNWYEVARREGLHGELGQPAEDVIKQLATRCQELKDEMRASPALYTLNISRLTSPTSNGRDRVR